MQLLPLLLMAVIMAVDSGLKPVGSDWGLGRVAVVTMAIGPVLIIFLLTMLGMEWCRRQLDLGRVPGPIIAAERMARFARAAIVVNHIVVVLVFGWLGTVRSFVGNVIFLDEFIAVLPPLLGLIGLWWAYYPIERRLRDAMLIRRLDDGRPVYPTPSRGGYVWLQVRLHLLLLLIPILAIVAVSECIERFADSYAPIASIEWIKSIGRLAVAAGVFILSPLLARLLLDVHPLPPGEVREPLLDVCRRHKVRVRELLIWNTNGTMINAAVMGLIGPLRYVLITDALLETLRQEQVRAVMAHEIGHVRRHHMPWLVACLMASFILATPLVELPMRGIEALGWIRSQTVVDLLSLASTAGQLIIGLCVFGWICRRFERQADTFAVQHLSGMGEPTAKASDDSAAPVADPAQPISLEAVNAMRSALNTIAHLNSIDPERPSWRHGSIAWRVRYLRSIIGRPTARLPIDRTIRWIKVAVALVLLGAVGYATYEGFEGPQPDTTGGNEQAGAESHVAIDAPNRLSAAAGEGHRLQERQAQPAGVLP